MLTLIEQHRLGKKTTVDWMYMILFNMYDNFRKLKYDWYGRFFFFFFLAFRKSVNYFSSVKEMNSYIIFTLAVSRELDEFSVFYDFFYPIGDKMDVNFPSSFGKFVPWWASVLPFGPMADSGPPLPHICPLLLTCSLLGWWPQKAAENARANQASPLTSSYSTF